MLTMSDEITTSEHRAAWDTTISAPKSVSLGALVGGDGRIREAHRESVNETLKEFEKYLQARGGGPPSRHDFCPNRSGVRQASQIGFSKPPFSESLVDDLRSLSCLTYRLTGIRCLLP